MVGPLDPETVFVKFYFFDALEIVHLEAWEIVYLWEDVYLLLEKVSLGIFFFKEVSDIF